MSPEERETLCNLRPALTNVIGFYDLLYEPTHELTPYQRMVFEAHFATSSREIAVTLVQWIDVLMDPNAD